MCVLCLRVGVWVRRCGLLKYQPRFAASKAPTFPHPIFQGTRGHVAAGHWAPPAAAPPPASPAAAAAAPPRSGAAAASEAARAPLTRR